jgi:predicted ferric reductase
LANIALAVLFAGRNNPLTYITGLSRTTCLIFHLWAARVATIQVIIHFINYTIAYYWDGSAAAFNMKASKLYFWWGIIGTVALFLGTALSVLPLRLRSYEKFLITHIIIVVLALAGCWYHVQNRSQQHWGYEVWLYIAFAFWAFDRLARVAIIGFRNFGGKSTQAFAELMPGGFIKLTVFPSTPWTGQPGQHCFLFFKSAGRFWESHPFSIAEWSNGNSASTIAISEKTKAGSNDVDIEKDARASISTRNSKSSLDHLITTHFQRNQALPSSSDRSKVSLPKYTNRS